MAKFHKEYLYSQHYQRPLQPRLHLCGATCRWQKELNIVIETKDIPNDEAKRTVEDAKINNAERFFQQLKIDGYEVKFCRQLQNKKWQTLSASY